MGGPPNLATWSPRQHRRRRPIRPHGALCPQFLHSRGVTCACQKAIFAPITGRHGRVDQLHVRPVSGHSVEDEIASCAPLAWVCAGDGRAISNGRLVCDRPTRRTLPDASLPPPPHRVLRSERLLSHKTPCHPSPQKQIGTPAQLRESTRTPLLYSRPVTRSPRKTQEGAKREERGENAVIILWGSRATGAPLSP